jgi:hypothetical protein
MCRLFGDSLSPLQPTNVAELGSMRYLTTMRRVVLQQCFNTLDGPDSSMRAKAASLAPDEKTVLWVLMAKAAVEQRVELAEPGSESCISKTLLTAAAAVNSAAVVHIPSTLGADTAVTADQL